jgi:hypothetical protein
MPLRWIGAVLFFTFSAWRSDQILGEFQHRLSLEDTDTDTLLADEQPRRLPVPKQLTSGGILYFLHVPKSGGTTVREFLGKRVDELVVARKAGPYNDMATYLDQLVVNGTNGKLIAFETHDSNVPSYPELSVNLRRWKATAKANNVPIFYFTLLREPVSFQISAFNYYYLHEKRAIANDTVTDFIDTLMYNPQCQFLYNGGGFFGLLDGHVNRRDDILTRMNARLQQEHCDQVYQQLFDDMDWVGATERMKVETLPLINYLTNRTGAPMTANQSLKRMTMSRLTESHRQTVIESAKWDTEWYEKMQETFPFSPWEHAV